MAILRSIAVLGILLLVGDVRSLDTATVSVAQLAKGATSWDGSVLPEYPRGEPEITVLRITIPPHGEIPMHKHPVINVGVMTQGRLTVETANGKQIHLKAGDALLEVVDQWHRGVNDSDEPAEIVVVYAGIVGQPITIKP